MIETLIYIAVGLFAVGIPILYIIRDKRSSAAAATALASAVEQGLDEPVSLHPSVDLNTCIGTGACVKACPEDKVIGLIHGKATLINPSHCIGHGLCAAACPVEAITLVFGTEKRGVDIPHVNGNFETNVPGIYIAGELGGMGLIRNAVTQGRQTIQNIAKTLAVPVKTPGVHDVAIIGAGPAGIAAALQAKKEGLDYLLLDQEEVGGAILTYPRRKIVMTQPMELPMHGIVGFKEISKEALLELFYKVISTEGLLVKSGAKVENIDVVDGIFSISTSLGIEYSHRVVLAIGRRGTPRKLGVPGEKSSHVAYRMLDPEKYAGMNILVVGGGDSAVEAALALAQQDCRVTISYRRESFFRLKEKNRKEIESHLSSGKIFTLFNSEVKEIREDCVIVQRSEETLELPCGQVFILAGGELPVEFLKRIGIEFTRKFGKA